MSSFFKQRVAIIIAGLVFMLACSVGVATPAPAVSSFDPTKAALELEATAMSLQLTQAALNNLQQAQPAPTQAPPQAAPTAVPPTAVPPTVGPQPTATSSMPPFETWIKDADILLFEDMAGSLDRRRYINQALDDMGLRYRDVSDALGYYKTEILSYGPDGTGWDLIISGKELRDGVQGEFYDYLSDALRDGSSVIIEEWNMDGIGGGKLSLITNRCGVSFQRDWFENNLEEHAVYQMDPANPIFHTPNNGIKLNTPTGYWILTDLGDIMRLSAGGDAVPLWGTDPNSKSDDLVAVSCIDGRLIIQTYSTHSYREDHVIRVWENYIYNTLKARYDYLAANP